jgi:glycerol kinase
MKPISGKDSIILAIDQGTSGTRCAAFDTGGSMISYAYAPHSSLFPHPGWVEQDPIELWLNTKYVIKGSLRGRKIVPSRIRAIGITNQRETTIVWDKKTGVPIYNAIVWEDTRTNNICRQLDERGLTSRIRSETGLPLSAYFSATKIRWLLDNVPNARARALAGDLVFGTVDTWLIWNLTRGKEPRHGRSSHLTDTTNASRTMLLDIDRLQWSHELLEDFGIPESILPEIRASSSGDPYGYTSPDGPLGRRVPICGDLGDQQASLFGQACFEPGEAKNTYGSGSFLLQNVGTSPVFSNHGLVSTVGYTLSDGSRAYALEGSVSTSGIALSWLAENLRLMDNPRSFNFESLPREGSSGVYFVPAFSGLFAPNWDPLARGLIIGLTQFTRREHIVRAALEAICFQTRDVVEAMKNDTSIGISRLKVDGGASANEFLMQLQADILGIPVVRPRSVECTATGAAFAAGLGADVFKDLKEIRSLWESRRLFRPKWSNARRNESYALWKRAVDRTRGWLA